MAVAAGFQAKRGGCVQLANIVMPQMEFGGPEDKGDALYAMELALSLEKLNFQKLRALCDVAEEAGDAQMSDFVEGSLLDEQVIVAEVLYCGNGQWLSFLPLHKQQLR